MKREILDNMVSMTDFATKSSAIVQKTESGNTQFILKRNKVVAALIDIELYLAIQEASENWNRDIDGGEWDSILEYAQALVDTKRAESQDSAARPIAELWKELGPMDAN